MVGVTKSYVNISDSMMLPVNSEQDDIDVVLVQFVILPAFKSSATLQKKSVLSWYLLQLEITSPI